MEKTEVNIRINLVQWYLLPYKYEADLRYEGHGYYKKTYSFLCFEFIIVKR